MTLKRKISDFLCAFLAFSIVLLSIALLAGESFFEGTVVVSDSSIVVFGTEFALDRCALSVFEKLLQFNDVIFGEGFSDVAADICGFFAQYVKNGVRLAYGAARWAVGH